MGDDFSYCLTLEITGDDIGINFLGIRIWDTVNDERLYITDEDEEEQREDLFTYLIKEIKRIGKCFSLKRTPYVAIKPEAY